jgi:hypothetical protein
LYQEAPDWIVAELETALKGRGFSRAVSSFKSIAALAAEGTCGSLQYQTVQDWRNLRKEQPDTKKSGLKAVTLIAAPNPVSQVLW